MDRSFAKEKLRTMETAILGRMIVVISLEFMGFGWWSELRERYMVGNISE